MNNFTHYLIKNRPPEILAMGYMFLLYIGMLLLLEEEYSVADFFIGASISLAPIYLILIMSAYGRYCVYRDEIKAKLKKEENVRNYKEKY